MVIFFSVPIVSPHKLVHRSSRWEFQLISPIPGQLLPSLLAIPQEFKARSIGHLVRCWENRDHPALRKFNSILQLARVIDGFSQILCNLYAPELRRQNERRGNGRLTRLHWIRSQVSRKVKIWDMISTGRVSRCSAQNMARKATGVPT